MRGWGDGDAARNNVGERDAICIILPCGILIRVLPEPPFFMENAIRAISVQETIPAARVGRAVDYLLKKGFALF